ncbi:MAG: GNAT family N-acetyltransferase [Spartobacteria bacterium]
MKLVKWVRFSWDLSRLPMPAAALPPHYSFGAAARADERELRNVIRRSFTNDTAWGDALHDINGMLDRWLERAFEPERAGICLTLRHGLRIIGASIVLPDPTAAEQLAPGPCIQLEYRNRGLGTALLAESLGQLRAAGLTHATALTKSNAPVARFLYPKFNGVLAPDDTPLLAA